ncbi:MAG: hypothetical protein ABI343_20095, partial [Burkholderiaceae bacterium]
LPRSARQPMDFRSMAFRDDAEQLVQTTGCTLTLCRQELFIAEGDIEEARRVLVERKPAAATIAPLH